MSDPVNHHPHSRFSLHEKANLFPFRDLIWNKSDGPFIDLKVDFPDPSNHYADGTAYLRVEDVVEMAHVLGMATLEEVEALHKENAELKAKLLQLPTKVESFKNELSRTTSEFLASLDSTVTLALADVEEPSYAEPSYLTEQSSIVEPVWDAPKQAGKGTKSGNRDSGKSDESAEQSGDESTGSEGPNELSGPVSNTTDPLADFFGIKGKD